MPTVDANVWGAAFDTKDRFHDDSVAFLRSLAGAATITMFRLRAAGALYAATAARRTNGVLVSWDNDLVERAGAVTPTAWLGSHR